MPRKTKAASKTAAENSDDNRDSNKSVGFTHPDYDKMLPGWEKMRDALEGEQAMKEYAEKRDYILVPAAMRQSYSGGRAAWTYKADNYEAHCYVTRARYPDVVMRAVDVASGKAMSRDPQITAPKKILDILDDLWEDGSDFETGVMKVLNEALSTRCGGLFVNPESADNQARICLYPAENFVNWRRNKSKTSLVVLEDSVPSEDIFSHEMQSARLVMGLDETGKYYAERYLQDEGDWHLEGERTYPTSRQDRLNDIPFVPLGGWDLHQPPFMPLARAAEAYFRASAEYNHIMWWTATPQPFINFTEGGNFYGVDEFSASAVQSEGEAKEQNIELTYGSSKPLMLRNGTFGFAAAPSGALSAHQTRLNSLREEIAGLGSRAFQNRSGGRQTAETERMQQAGEGAVVWLVLREVAQAITSAVRVAAGWRGISGADEFTFEFNRNINFEPFDMTAIGGMSQLVNEGYIRRADMRRLLRKLDVIEPGITDEELDKMIEEEQQRFGSPNESFGGGFDEELPPDDDIEDEIIEDETQEEDADLEEAA